MSVGIPVWNGETFIRAGLDSLLGQTFDDLELIISDNASTDATQAICEAYAERDPRIRYHRNAHNLGLQANFEKVLELASTPYFMWGCPDDLWDATYVGKMVAVLDSRTSVVVAGSNAAAIDAHGVLLGHFDNSAVYSPGAIADRARTFIRTPPGGGHATLIYGLMRTPVIQRLGYAPPRLVRDPNRGYYATDLLTLFRLMLEGDFHVVEETLYFHRDTYFGHQGLQRFAAVARSLRGVHGYYGDLRAVLRESVLDERQASSLVRSTFGEELRFYPAYLRRLMGPRIAIHARGAGT